ncbi:Ubiquitin carboxyl-terminal hydrolase 48 [Leucoagaricus sp. SymC.cos]|nr:Ubiquitin carboxyl-terminal hydrolase 48 [Leucoagaricus sp. SymC.cos]
MPPKRRKRSPVPNKGLAPGESLKRYLVPTRNSQSTLWSWVGSEASEATDITLEHCLIACGLSARNNNPFCPNKFVTSQAPKPLTKKEVIPDDDIIVVSDDEEIKCLKKTCKENPNCLNHLGQEKWENEENALRDFLEVTTVGFNPNEDSRVPEQPVGLKSSSLLISVHQNLGATCYANASIQVWYRNLAFRKAVYQCQPQRARENQDSPLFQLQATFAALQNGLCKVFNPTSLVESLQLRTAEQQDAQEFSKLFMSHLDTEFRNQAAPGLRSLVSDQFQGSQIYGTMCDTCQYRSERTADFLEIEVRFEGKSALEDCISSMLQEERLTGDNQYHCPQCDCLRDATRYTQVSQLPPVLHFSLLRFVYDFVSLERRKSKHTISFPTSLDMKQFLKRSVESGQSEENVYELAGILLHKGTSAYHGHYEAQVYDTEKQSWFQFNDEVVTRIKALGDKKGSKDAPIVVDEEASSSQIKQPAKKRRRIVSDDEAQSRIYLHIALRVISSRDAYMLIYVRASDRHSRNADAPVPPQQVSDYVESLNREHEEKCRLFSEKQELIKSQFSLIRQQVMDVYKSWDARSVDDDCVILSSKWLQNWLAQDCMNLAKPFQVVKDIELGDKPVEVSNDEPASGVDDSVICVHHKLDPTKAKNMKRVKRDAYQKIMKLTGSIYEPLSPQDVCRDCVLAEFKEFLYSIDHPKHVQQFDKVSEVGENGVGYWISKRWIKDWRLLKPKMHKSQQEDPTPDSLGFRSDVWCEHGSLALSSLNRRMISQEGVDLLKRSFPSWEPPRGDAEPCVVCDALMHISKEDKRELRRRAEEEKTLLKSMYEETPFAEEDDSFAIIPTNFFKGWISWLNSPADHERSDKLDNSCFLCEHGLLSFDPNCPSDVELTITIIRQSDWDVLQKLYDGRPRIALRKAKPTADGKLRYDSDIPVCEGCRLKRKTEWVSTDIIVQLLPGKKTGTSTNRQPIAAYSNRNGTRHSKRLRQARENEKRKFAVTKKSTIKDIKVKIQNDFKIPTICQRLFFREQELQNNEVTVEELQMFANETLYLREESEVNELDSDSDEKPTKRQKREAERGFGGTLLSGGGGDFESGQCQKSNSREDTPHGFSQMSSEKVCAVCTLLNAYDAVVCKVCDTLFV